MRRAIPRSAAKAVAANPSRRRLLGDDWQARMDEGGRRIDEPAT
jgi:hypothetical protein